MSYAIKARCRYCDTNVEFFGQICSDCSEDAYKAYVAECEAQGFEPDSYERWSLTPRSTR